MCAYMILFTDIMGPQTQYKDIQTLRGRLCDELIKSKTSGSVKELHIDVLPKYDTFNILNLEFYTFSK